MSLCLMSRLSDGAEDEAGFLLQISTSFAQPRSCTISPVRPLRGSFEVCSVFVQIRLANQMLMLVSGRVARQGSYRMVISVELAYNKEADYLSPLSFFFFFSNHKPRFKHSLIYSSIWSVAWRQYSVIKIISVIFCHVGVFSNGALPFVISWKLRFDNRVSQTTFPSAHN